MKKESFVKFNDAEIEEINSASELSEISGGKNIIKEILETIGIEIDNNCGSGGCNNCNC